MQGEFNPKKKIELHLERRKVEFNPEKEITEKDWEGIKARAEEYRRKAEERDMEYDWWAYLQQVREAITVFPRRAIELNVPEIARRITKRILDRAYRMKNWRVYSAIALDAKIIFPQTIDVKLDETVWKGIKSLLEEYRQTDRWEDFWWLAVEQRFHFPEKISELLDESIWQKLKNKKEEARKKGEWELFLARAMEERILFPEKFRESKVDKNELVKQGIKSVLEKYCKANDYGSFSWELCKAKILFSSDDELYSPLRRQEARP